MKKILVILIAVSLIAAFVSNASAEKSTVGPAKYGWVDLKKVMMEYYKTEEMLQQFDEEKAAKEAEVTKLVEEIEKMDAGLLLLSTKARAEQEEKILKSKMAVNMLIQESEQELGKQSMLKQEGLLKDIIAVSDKLAAREGYTFIFRGEVLLYKDPALDCSNQIIEILNKGHEGKKD